MKRYIILLYKNGEFEVVKYKNKLKRKISKYYKDIQTVFIPMEQSLNSYLPIKPSPLINFDHADLFIDCKCINCYLEDPDEYTEINLNTSFSYSGNNLVEFINSLYNIIEFDTICDFILHNNIADVEYDYDVYGLAISIIPYTIKLKLYDDNNELMKIMDFQVDSDIIFSAITNNTMSEYNRDPITLKNIFNAILYEFDWIFYNENEFSLGIKLNNNYWEYINDFQLLDNRDGILVKTFFDKSSNNFGLFYYIDEYKDIINILNNDLHVEVFGGIGALDMMDINNDELNNDKLSSYTKAQIINYIEDGYFFPCINIYFPLDNLGKISVALSFLNTLYMFTKFYLSLLYTDNDVNDLSSFILISNFKTGEKYILNQYDFNKYDNLELIERCTMGGGYVYDESR